MAFSCRPMLRNFTSKIRNFANRNEDTTQCMRGAFLLSNFTKLTPFQWHSSQAVPGSISKSWEILLWSFHFMMTLVYVIHLTIRCWISFHDESLELWKKAYVQFLTIQMALGFAWLQSANYFHRQKLPCFMGRYMEFFQSAKVVTLLSDTHKGFLTKQARSFVRGLRLALYGNAAVLGWMCLLRPDTPDLWTAWFLQSQYIPWLERLPWTAIQLYYGVSYANCGVVYSCCNFCFVFPTIKLLRNMGSLGLGNREWKRLLERIRYEKLGHEKLLKIYRQLYLLVEEFNTIYGMIMSATKVTFIMTAVFCTYGAIKLGGVVSGLLAFLGISLMIFFAAMMVTMGEVNNASKLFLQQIKIRHAYRRGYDKQCISDLLFEKSLKSTQELKIRIGSTYFMDKGIALTTFKITTDNTINFLLTNH